jgi:hypothetical protein
VPVLEEPVLLEPVAEVMPVAVEIPEPTLRYLPRPEVEEYRLAAEEPVRLRNRLDPLALLFAADEEYDEEDEPEEEVEETPEEETAQDDSDERERRFERRFTWESPEMYWRDRDEEAVA